MEHGKETNTHLFFFGVLLDPPPPSTFLIEYVFSTDMFLEIFFLCEETILGCNSQNMSKINGVTRELNVCTLSADFCYCLLLGCLSLHWYFDLTFGPYIWYFKCVHTLPQNFERFRGILSSNSGGHFFFSAFGQTPPPPPFGSGSMFCHPLDFFKHLNIILKLEACLCDIKCTGGCQAVPED